MGAYNRQGGRVEKGRFFFWRKEMHGVSSGSRKKNGGCILWRSLRCGETWVGHPVNDQGEKS